MKVDLHILEELLRLRVIFRFDLVIIQKVLLNRSMAMELESALVECVLVLFSCNVVDGYLMRRNRPVGIRLGLSNVRRRRRRAIFVVLEKVENGVYVVLRNALVSRLLIKLWLELDSLNGVEAGAGNSTLNCSGRHCFSL